MEEQGSNLQKRLDSLNCNQEDDLHQAFNSGMKLLEQISSVYKTKNAYKADICNYVQLGKLSLSCLLIDNKLKRITLKDYI